MSTRIFARFLIVLGLCLAPLTGNTSTSVEVLLQQAEAVRSSDPKTFEQLLQQLQAQSAQATPAQQEQVQYLSAYANSFAGRYDLGTQEARRLVETSKDVDMRYRASALIVNNYALTRQFAEGLRELERTLSMADQVKDPVVRLYGFWAATLIYNQIGQYRLGLEYAERILAGPAPERQQCFAKQSKLEALQNLDELPDDTAIMQVVDQCVAQHELAVANFVRATLARKWAAEGKRSKAIALLQKYIDEAEATQYPRLISEIRALLAELLLAEGDVSAAEVHAQATIAQSASIINSWQLVSAYKVMYQIADGRQDPIAALTNYRRYAEADKAYLNDVNARELAYQIVRQETQQKSQQIELLHHQNQVLQLQQRVDKQSAQNTRLLIVLLVLSLALIGYWAYGIKRRQLSLRRLAETDALTGVSNRHHFTQQSERALAKSAQAGEQAALLMFDLDHFKAINDSYGHVTGDWVLTRVAEACKGFCRRIDHFGRLGGEEFAIFMQGMEIGVATRLAEDCRVRIASIDTRESGHAFAITASFGVSVTSLSGYDLARLLAHADKSLYRAKREGRNRVCAFNGDEPPARAQVIAIDGRSVAP